MRLASQRSPRNRVLVRIVDGNGDAFWFEEAGADALAAQWGPTLDSAGGVDAVAMHRLRNGIVTATVAPHLVTCEDLRQLLVRCLRSAPGLDGISYSHWEGAGEVGLRALHEA